MWTIGLLLYTVEKYEISNYWSMEKLGITIGHVPKSSLDLLLGLCL